MHTGRRDRHIKGTGPMGKAAVMGLLERHGPDKTSRVRLFHVGTNRKRVLHAAVRKNVERGANLYTDALKSYEGLSSEYTHQVMDHAESYVSEEVHTNGLENFWSLLKRAIKGTYVSVEPFIYSVTLTNRRTASRKAATTTAGASCARRAVSAGADSPTRN